MQEIKFRGLTKEGKWVYGYYYKSTTSGKSFIIRDLTDHPYRFTRTKDGFTEVIPETVGQFTGLHDKNGKEYYFNAVAKWNNKHWVVVWSVTLAGIQLQPVANYAERQKDTKIKRLYGPSFGIGQARSSEVIGNQAENPELLKEAK